MEGVNTETKGYRKRHRHRKGRCLRCFTALLLALALVITGLPDHFLAVRAEGKGTQDDPYIVNVNLKVGETWSASDAAFHYYDDELAENKLGVIARSKISFSADRNGGDKYYHIDLTGQSAGTGYCFVALYKTDDLSEWPTCIKYVVTVTESSSSGDSSSGDSSSGDSSSGDSSSGDSSSGDSSSGDNSSGDNSSGDSSSDGNTNMTEVHKKTAAALKAWNKKYIHINKTNVTLDKGKKVTLKIVNLSSKKKKKLKWKSGNKKIAIVSKKGVVKAKKYGKTTITAKSGKVKYTCKVTVAKKTKTVSISKKKALLSKGDKLTLKLKNAKASKVKWTTSKKAVATVSKKGVVTTKGAGKATITATYSKKKYQCTVNVFELKKLGDAKLTVENNEVKIGDIEVAISPFSLEDKEQTLTVSKAESVPAAGRSNRTVTYDFTMSGGGELGGVARISVPLELKDDEIALAMTLDEKTGEWNMLPCDAHDGVVDIVTDHFCLEQFEIMSPHDIRQLLKDLDLTKASMDPEFVMAVIVSAMKGVTPKQAAELIVDTAKNIEVSPDLRMLLVGEMQKYLDGFSAGNDLLHALGFDFGMDDFSGEAFKYAALAVSIIKAMRYEVDGQPDKAAMEAMQALASYYVSVITSSLGSQLGAAAAFAVAAIVYPIKKIYDQQMTSNQETHYQALKHYYEEDKDPQIAKGRTRSYWKKSFANYLDGSITPEEAIAAIRSDFTSFANKFWETSDGTQEIYFQKAGVTGQITGWGNNPESREAATKKYVEVDLFGNLLPDICQEICDDKKRAAEQDAIKNAKKLAAKYNTTITLNFYDESYDAYVGWSDYAQWKVRFKNIPAAIKDKNNLECTLNKEGKGKITFTLLSDMLYKFGTELEICDDLGRHVADINNKFSFPTTKIDIDMTETRNWVKKNGMYISADKIEIKENETTGLYLKNAPDSVSWVSSDTAVATVSGGRVKGQNAGSCIIRATCKGKSFYCDMKVLEAVDKDNDGINELEKINMSVGDQRNAPGYESTTLKTTDLHGMTSEVLSTKWSSSNSSVVSIAGGVMYAKKNGKSNVTISQKVKYSHEYNECIPGSDGFWKTIKKKKTWTDTVKEEFLVVVSKRQFSLNKTSLYMKVGNTDTITLKNTVASTEVTWSSSNPGVASIRETGEHNQYCVVTAEKKGTALIKAKVGKQSYSCKVTVIESTDATGIELTPKEAVVHVGGSKTFKLKGATASKVKWSVSNPGVASISKKGKVTGKAVGLTYVYASYKGTKYVAECWVDP